MIDWQRVRNFVHKRTLFCTAVVEQSDGVRVFPIGSLRVKPDGSATYFEVFARPAEAGARVTFLAVDISPLFWLRSLIKGQFLHPPGLRLHGQVGERRDPTEGEVQGWHRRVGWLLRTPGGKALWSRPGPIRELQFDKVKPVRTGSMTRELGDWLVP